MSAAWLRRKVWPLAALVAVAGCRPSAEPSGTSPTVDDTPLRAATEVPASPPPPPVATGDGKTGQPRRRVRPPFDPLRDNGPVFEGWPAPKLAIVITGRQDGYLEPCGCAGLDRMRGGLSRRQTMIESLRKRGWPLVVLDAGGLSKRVGPQALLKFRVALEAMAEMGYDAIGLGTSELRFPAADLVNPIAGEEGRAGRFVSANVGLFGLSAQLTPRKRIVEAAEMKVGVTSILGKKYQREIHNPDVELTDPEAALEPLVAELRPACDLMILLAHATQEESLALARRFPAWDVVVTTDGPPVPPAEPLLIDGGSRLLIQVGERVKDAVVLGVYDKPASKLRYQRVPLDARFPVAATAKARMAGHQAELRQLGLDGLGVRPVPHPRRELQGDFVGTKKCAECHAESHDVWQRSGHARATRTLVELDPPRQFDPECLACHVTGWHPAGFLPYESGYLSPEATPALATVGCESCHGPGGGHAAAEEGADEALQQQLRQAVVLTKDEAKRRTCAACHGVSNSPDFDFDAYLPDVAHTEKENPRAED